MGRYYTQLVCMNGHQITDRLETFTGMKNFCSDCGSQTISCCQQCNSPISGDYEVSGIVSIGFQTATPSYCSNCGNSFPWTKKLLDSAFELLALDTNLDVTTKELIKNALPDLIVDTPATNLAVARYQIYIGRTSRVVKDAMHNLLVDVVSETVKKSLFS